MCGIHVFADIVIEAIDNAHSLVGYGFLALAASVYAFKFRLKLGELVSEKQRVGYLLAEIFKDSGRTGGEVFKRRAATLQCGGYGIHYP